MKDIIFISFDIRKDDYPSMPYSIACLIAVSTAIGFKAGHYSIDLQHVLGEKKSSETITDNVRSKLYERLNYFKEFRYIAISLNSWSIEYCQSFLSMLNDYSGKVILGGYEVTSRIEDDLFNSFPRADYFIKGYGENSIKRILLGLLNSDQRILDYPVETSDLISPYLTGILPLFSKKIYWETKRGCPHKCGFCEWGNATSKLIDIDNKRLFQEIDKFSNSATEEVNILDGTFNYGINFLDIFKQLLKNKAIKITVQVHFTNLKSSRGRKFLELCAENKDRVCLEFGLQTIHRHEMEMIGRKNNMNIVSNALMELKEKEINFEVSIIYAIPGQSVTSFIDTIEYLLLNGCETIRAFPLCIPKNSDMQKKKNLMLVKEGKNNYNVYSVQSSYSFTIEQRDDMDRIASRLNSGDIKSLNNEFFEFILNNDSIRVTKVSDYLWEFMDIPENLINKDMKMRILQDYITPTLSDIKEKDFRQELMYLGEVFGHSEQIGSYFKDLINGKVTFELKKFDIPLAVDPIVKGALDRIDKNLQEKKYKCKMLIGRSSNLYIYREITN